MDRLRDAVRLIDSGDPGSALGFLEQHLDDNPNDAECLYTLGAALFDRGNIGVAFQMFQQSMRIAPEKAAPYNGIGRCLSKWNQREDAATYYAKALEKDPQYRHALSNMGTVMHAMGRHDDAMEVYNRAVDLDPDVPDTLGNMGMVLMTKGDWSSGWRCMHAHVGCPERPERFYGHAQMWLDGEFDRLVVYGEQGGGDEVFFSALLPELKGGQVLLETSPKLAGLFSRSFPWLTVKPTRTSDPLWATDFHPTHKIPISSLPMHFWPSPNFCPRKPYLKACPDRRKMVRALLDGLPGKKIGLAWTGGMPVGNGYERQIDAETMLRGLGVSPWHSKRNDVTFISLQYKEPPLVPGVIHWPWMVESPDYDDTAALVAELDAVISVPTSVINLSGALGTPTWVLLPDDYHHWRYGLNQDMHPWFGCVRIVRQPWDLVRTLVEATDGARKLRAA